jgi:hypothetical protein
VQCGVEADAVLVPVEPILPRVPSEVHGNSRIYAVVYTLVVLGGEGKGKFTKLISNERKIRGVVR